MNWTNYRRLVDYLQALPPDRFHYGRNTLGGDCGCVAVHAVVGGMVAVDQCEYAGSRHLRELLGVTQKESRYLFGFGQSPDEPSAMDLDGAAGLTEALRRLSVVATRYGGEPASAQPAPTFQPDEAGFLASVRALVAGAGAVPVGPGEGS